MISLHKQKYFMDIAERTAQESYAKKLKVGAVAVRDGRSICQGYNGTPPGEDNTCEEVLYVCDDPYRPYLKTKDDVEHAERNLIYFAARHGIRLEDASLFITHSPCIPCARAIYNVGFKDIYYATLFNDPSGLEWLAKRGVEICLVPRT